METWMRRSTSWLARNLFFFFLTQKINKKCLEKNLHQNPLVSSEYFNSKRTQEHLLGSLKVMVQSWISFYYWSPLFPECTWRKLRGHSWLLSDLTVNWQRCLVLNIFIWNTSPIIEYLGSTSSPPCLHYLLQGSYKDVLGIWWINFQDPIQESNRWCQRYQIHIVT